MGWDVVNGDVALVHLVREVVPRDVYHFSAFGGGLVGGDLDGRCIVYKEFGGLIGRKTTVGQEPSEPKGLLGCIGAGKIFGLTG